MNSFDSSSGCKACWRFESWALLNDSLGGNTLTAFNTPAAESLDYQEGSACLRLKRDSAQYLAIADASLDAGFPLKLGDQIKQLTWAGWFQTLSSSEQVLFCKSDLNRQSLATILDNGTLRIEWGFNTGQSKEVFNCPGQVIPGQWYHLFLLVDGINRYLQWSLYNAKTYGLQTCNFRPVNELWVGNVDLYLGAAPDGRYFDGRLDETIVFQGIMPPAVQQLIRLGLYGADNPYIPNHPSPTEPAGWRWDQHFWQ